MEKSPTEGTVQSFLGARGISRSCSKVRQLSKSVGVTKTAVGRVKSKSVGVTKTAVGRAPLGQNSCRQNKFVTTYIIACDFNELTNQ